MNAPKDCPLCRGEGFMFGGLCSAETCGYFAEAHGMAEPELAAAGRVTEQAEAGKPEGV